MRLVDGTHWLEPFRQKFGDERADYAAALGRHHAQGAPPGWADNHVTAYASAHPAEDWAEILSDPANHLHLYGKAAARPGRKMGHVTRLTLG